jgi:hypothetical protein
VIVVIAGRHGIEWHPRAGIPKLFSIELLRRKRDTEGQFGHGTYGIFATPRDEAMQFLAESDVTVLTDPTIDRQYPCPINSKIKEYWDDVWQQINRDRKLIYPTEIPRNSIPRVRTKRMNSHSLNEMAQAPA